MLHKPDPTNLKPCRHMQALVSAWTDGKLKGLARWYTERHVHSCPQCQLSLPFLRALHHRLFTLAGGEHSGGSDRLTKERLTKNRWDAVEAAWKETETKL